jgi:hypothetical protein
MSENTTLHSRQAVATELQRRMREPPPGRVQEVYYWRQEPLEVDGVLVGSWGKWAVEVNTGYFTTRDLCGLLEFCRRHPYFQPLALCSRERADDAVPGVRLMYWGDFLLGKPLPE